VTAPQAFAAATAQILNLQREDGAVMWTEAGIFDPWNHVECAMALSAAGEVEAAARAYDRLAADQLPDGSWWGEYGSAVPLLTDETLSAGPAQRVRDTNHAAYAATGVWHHYLCTNDRTFLKRMFPVAEAALDFVVSLQSSHGDIRWTARDPHTPQDDALLTGNSSIYKSLEAGLAAADAMGAARPHWREARAAVGEAVRRKPERFDRTWPSNDRFSMDWYYPVLGGALTGATARARIATDWDRFVAEGLGCRCVDNEPWVTAAESCELVLALLACGMPGRARAVFDWRARWRDPAGGYWMGWQYEEEVFWPNERPSWTAAAVLLAADALYGWSGASRLFTAPTPEARDRCAAAARGT